jgi:hypothetical protein
LIEYARLEAECSKPGPDGVPQRDTWEAAAARGNVQAQRKLDSAELPDCLAYLWGWFLELYGRSGAGMAGLLPLSYTEVDAWARLTGNDPNPLEVEALMLLDAVMRTDKRPDPEPVPVEAWPRKRNG